MNINDCKLLLEYIVNKNQSGNTITIPQFNLVAENAQLQKYETDYKEYESTQEITDNLSPFLVPAMVIYVTSTDGVFTSVGFWGRESATWKKFTLV